MRHSSAVLALLIAATLTACATAPGAYQPIVDRPGPSYASDLADCRALAEQAHPAQTATGGAVAGAVLGGALGAIIGGRGGALLGAKVGGVEGLAGGAAHGIIMQRTVVMSCLIGRGHRVIG